jgi:hypothetical protein
LGLNEDAPWQDVAAGLRQSAESCEGCPCPLCLRRTSGCSEGLERRVASLPSPQHNPYNRRVLRQQQQAEMNPPNPPPVGADPVISAQMQIMQQMVDTMADMHAQMRQEREEMR